MKKAAILGLALAAMTACAPIVRFHGYVPPQEELAQVQPGRSTRAEVIELLPAVTTKGMREDGNLYFVRSRFETVGPLEPKEVSRQVLALTFNSAGILTGIETYGLQDGRVVVLNRRVTDDNIADVSFIRQLMGSFGRIDAGALFGDT